MTTTTRTEDVTINFVNTSLKTEVPMVITMDIFTGRSEWGIDLRYDFGSVITYLPTGESLCVLSRYKAAVALANELAETITNPREQKETIFQIVKLVMEETGAKFCGHELVRPNELMWRVKRGKCYPRYELD